MKLSDIPRIPDTTTLRQFAGLWVLFFGAIGGYLRYQGTETWWWVWLVVALGVGLPGFAFPRFLKPIFVTWMILAFPIGWVVSHVILFLVFYFVFFPLGLLLRLFGHDPLKLRRPSTESCWQDNPQKTDLRRYLRQF